jgi:threonine/homoserine/homoserine lactone efflux protein
MNWQLWDFFVVTETALCFVPGPAVLLVLSQGLRHGTQKAVFSILGIVGANTVYFCLSATGIGAVLMASYQVFFAIKWIGAAYLVWLGLSALFGKSRLVSVSASDNVRSNAAKLFANGFILQMSNPKALMFFTALLPQFIDPHATLWTQVLILAATSIVIEFFVQLLYATLAGRATSLVTQPRFAKITDRVAGSFLIAAGAGLAAIRR